MTPREVSVSDLDFLDTIYAPGPHSKRNKDVEKVKALGIDTSIGRPLSMTSTAIGANHSIPSSRKKF